MTGSGERSEEPAAEAESGQDAREEREEAEGVEIPKQQAADEAADREAGEGARA
ncbi:MULTISPECIES: gliding motility protein [unclassified Streptomyces]|uniref:gliding motility protein n=1 Tax=unclassified Streptomyces TaxID=2593676 RepID=UPI00333104EF